MSEWEETLEKMVDLQSTLTLFKAEFFDRDKFQRFANDLFNQVGSHDEVCITGYFSEAARKQLERVIRRPHTHVRLICPHFAIKYQRDRKNLEALAKLSKAGAEVRVNYRLHSRFLASYSPVFLNKDRTVYRGTLIIGSFDFNTECIGMERYDGGIKTSHPDLIESAVKLFEEIWNESPLLHEKYEHEIEKMKI